MELDPDFKPGLPLWQGDLLGFSNWARADPLQRYGVIITADCDIQRARPDQELVFLRVVTQADYIDVIWSRSKLERVRDTRVRDLTQMMNRLRKQIDPEANALEGIDVERWIGTAAPIEICDALSLNDADDKARLIENVDRARIAVDYCHAPPGSACLDRLTRCRNEAHSALFKQASRELGKLRDDLFFVTGITESADDKGYYILLDQIGAVRPDQITDSLTEVRDGKKRAYRFGRLARVYKYAMAQRFSLLFQRIGLPDDYTERHSQALGRLSPSITSMNGDV